MEVVRRWGPAQVARCIGPVVRGEQRIGGHEIPDAVAPQLLHQPILMGPVIALDAALGLRPTPLSRNSLTRLPSSGIHRNEPPAHENAL
jgi:hypothetical protein